MHFLGVYASYISISSQYQRKLRLLTITKMMEEDVVARGDGHGKLRTFDQSLSTSTAPAKIKSALI